MRLSGRVLGGRYDDDVVERSVFWRDGGVLGIVETSKEILQTIKEEERSL